MNAYARKKDAESDPSYAPLTSGLLARKGQASPAFDSDAYSEITMGGEYNAPVSPIFNKPEPAPASHAPNSQHAAPIKPAPANGAPRPQAQQRPVQPVQQRQRPRPQKPMPAFRAVKVGPSNAAVTFRMPREEVIRLRRAAKELDMSCHRIILDAIECYLDANEVEPLSEDQWTGDAAEQNKPQTTD